MIFFDWWKSWLKTDFTNRGLLVRVVIDLILSNLGFLLGILITVGIWVFSWQVTPQVFFRKMFINVWLPNVPVLTFCCLFSYIVTGLYRGTRNMLYMKRIFVVSKAVGTAFFLFFSLLYMTRTFMPRSAIATTLIFIFVLILSVRLIWTAFTMRYNISRSSAVEPQI